MTRVTTATADVSLSSAELAAIVASFAARPAAWMDRVRFRVGRRWYERLHLAPDHDVWLITWLPGQATGFHDHGPSSGAFAVASGVLEEERPEHTVAQVVPGDVRTFGPAYAHDVRNTSPAPAISIHAYSPPLTTMTHYELDGDDLVPVDPPSTDDEEGESAAKFAPADAGSPRGIDYLLATARGRLHRLSAIDAYAAVARAGALLVDIRPAAQRAAEGEIPGALVIERNVLEWRLDPTSDARLAVATDHQLQVIVFCSEGYTSSLAAAALQDIGLWRATDVIGGFHAWQAAGLPSLHSRPHA